MSTPCQTTLMGYFHMKPLCQSSHLIRHAVWVAFVVYGSAEYGHNKRFDLTVITIQIFTDQM